MESFKLINESISSAIDNKPTYFIYNDNTIYIPSEGVFANSDLIKKYFIKNDIYDVLKKDMENIYKLLIEKKYPIKTSLELTKALLNPELIFQGQLLLKKFNRGTLDYYPYDIPELLRNTISNLGIKDALYYDKNIFKSLVLEKLDLNEECENNNVCCRLNNKKGTIKPIKYYKSLFPYKSAEYLGVWGEEMTINYLRKTYPNSEIIWVARDYGDGYGFDILCIVDDKEYTYEVKTLDNLENPILSIDEFRFIAGSHKTDNSYLITWKYGENPIPTIYKYDSGQGMFILNDRKYLPFTKDGKIILTSYTNEGQRERCNEKVLNLFNNKYKKNSY